MGSPSAGSGGAAAGGSYPNPSPIPGGGSYDPPPIGTPGFGGSTALPQPACPAFLPGDGTRCFAPPDYPVDYPYSCVYDIYCATVIADCFSEQWHLAKPDYVCGEAGAGGAADVDPIPPHPPATLSCPKFVPQHGAYCFKPSTISSYRCDYADFCSQEEATCTGVWNVVQLATDCGGAGGEGGI